MSELKGDYPQELSNENRLVKINPRFRDAIPPLDAEEYENLRESIKTEGCRDTIVIWGDVIVDGHNRFEICREYDIPFRTFEKTFDDEDAAEAWILRNQLGRRNLLDVERARLALKLKDVFVAQARENQLGGVNLSTNLSKGSSSVDTRKELAKIAGISEGTLSKVEKVDNEAPAPIREAMGKTISIDKAAKLNTVLKQTLGRSSPSEEERDAEARRLLLAELAEREARIYREEKIMSKLQNIISAAKIDYEYICGEDVDIYIRKSNRPISDVVNAIDGEIEWLVKLKEIFISRETAEVNGDGE